MSKSLENAVESTRIVLKERPDGQPTEANFESRVVTLPDLEDGAVRVRVSHISIDAFIRTTLDAVSFHGSVGIEAPVTALGVGRDHRVELGQPGGW